MGTNRRRFVQALAACGLAFPAARYRGFAQGLPDGVPENAQKATVTDHVDGDKYVADIDGSEFTVLMISADAPEMGKCFYTPSVKHLESLIPVGTTVYLERDGEATDKKGRLLCYTWKPREGKTAQFIDERMIADGCALFKSRDGHTTRDKRLSKAQETAKQHKRGIWADGACDPTANRTPTPVPTQSLEETGIPGFSQGLGQARSEFESAFGKPNEQYSSNGMFYYGNSPENHYTAIYWQGNVWLFTISLPNISMTDAQTIALAFIPPDSVLQYDAYPYTYKYTQFYYSESLSTRFPSPVDAPADAWVGSTPGIFNVSFNFEEDTGLVSEILMGPGERP